MAASSKTAKRIIVLDAGALINDPAFSFMQGESYITTHSVISELKEMKARLLAENAAKSKILKVEAPSAESLEKAKAAAKKLNTRLSKTDLDVLATAIQLKEEGKELVVATDDYSLQNVLSSLKIRFSPLLFKGIKRHFALKRKCKNCMKELSSSTCDFCGYDNSF